MIGFGTLFEQLFPNFWLLLPPVAFATLFKPAWFKGTSFFNFHVKF